MTVKEFIVCDGCGRIIEDSKERFKLKLESDVFWNGYDGYDRIVYELDFCKECALRIKDTLEELVEMKRGEKNGE